MRLRAAALLSELSSLESDSSSPAKPLCRLVEAEVELLLVMVPVELPLLDELETLHGAVRGCDNRNPGGLGMVGGQLTFGRRCTMLSAAGWRRRRAGPRGSCCSRS